MRVDRLGSPATLRWTTLLFGWTLTFSATSQSRALAAEGEQVIAGSVGAGFFRGERGRRAGPAAEVSWWLGATDWLWLAASLGSTGFVGSADDEPRWLVEAMGGLVVAVDHLRVVPHFEALMGLVSAPAEPTVRLGAGVDYFISRTLALGAVMRYRPLPEGSVFSASLRLSVRLDG